MSQHPFYAAHAHGFVRVSAATPVATSGDPAANAAATIAMAEEAERRRVDLVLFPELNISSYAIDDLHLQAAYLGEVERALGKVLTATESLRPVLLVGAALRRSGRLYNCALALKGGRILGVVPKSFLPNYREYYEKRWFAPGAGLAGLEIDIAGQRAPFGTDLIFAADGMAGFVFHMEICEDFWSATPPSTMGALAGALICTNLSASNIVIGKARERRRLAEAQAVRTVAAYVYSASGPGESTTDLAWDGQGFVYELGDCLAHSERFGTDPELVVADVDTERLRLERMRMGTFNDAAVHAGHPERYFRRVAFEHEPLGEDIGLERRLRRFPFVPNTPEKLDADCYEAFNIQVEGLAKRFQSTSGSKLVLGVSGGLDSTHALIVAAKAMDRLGRPRSDILGFTLPGFGTSAGTRSNAWKLMQAIGCTAEEIDIKPAAERMLADLRHPYANGELVYDLTFENVQAGLRTDYLFRLAGQRGGFVVGTGDMSELALGWCTYGVGDQMSHYGVNAGIPKTLIQYLIRWCTRTDQFDPATDAVLEAILATEISPELIPQGEDEELQSTQGRIGPYELHDFFLYWTLRYGMAPSKVAFLAWNAWRRREEGLWPLGFPEANRNEYDLAAIAKWLEVFLTRFFQTSQYKRSALPNGPKVSGGGSLSPRGDWRAPSDGVADAWLAELKRALPPLA